jgi:integrase
MSKRFPTEYPGIYYKLVPRLGASGKPKKCPNCREKGIPYKAKKCPDCGHAFEIQMEKSYLVVYKIDDRIIESRVGREFRDAMSAAKANVKRSQLIEGKAETRKEARTRKKAEKEAAVAAREADENRPTLGKLFQEFETAKADRKSIKDDRNRWNSYLAPDVADKLPSELVTLDVQRINKKLRDKGLSAQTRKHALVLLKRVISYAVDAGRIPSPYSKTFKIDVKQEIGKLDNEATEDLSGDQLDRLLTALDRAQDQQAANVMRLALASGLRRSELYRLRWDDCLFERGQIRIVGPKGGKTELIPMNSTARAILENIPRVALREGRTQVVDDYGNPEFSPWVFPGRNPRQHVVDLKKPINAIKRDAQLPKEFRPLHGLRHAFACNLMNSGKVTLPTLQKLMTHKSPEMTLRYAKIRDKQLEEASSVMDGILTRKPKKVLEINGKQAQGAA